MLPDVVNGEDVRMVQRRGSPGFLLKPVKAVRVGRQARGQDLDRYVAAQAGIAGAIDLAHPAGAKWREHFVRTKTIARL